MCDRVDLQSQKNPGVATREQGAAAPKMPYGGSSDEIIPFGNE